MSCIGINELEQFLAGKLPVERMLAVDEHIMDCADCRTLAMRSTPISRFAAEITGAADCPEYEKLSAYVEESLDPRSARAVCLHANLCEFCHRDIERIQEQRSHAALRDKIALQPGRSRQQQRGFLYYWKEMVAVGSVAILAGLAIMHNIGGPVAQAPDKMAANPPIRYSSPAAQPNKAPKSDSPAVAGKPQTQPPVQVAQNSSPRLAAAPVVLLRDGSYSVISKSGGLTLARTDGTSVASRLGARIAADIDRKLRTGKLAAPKLIAAVMTPITLRDDTDSDTVPPSAPEPAAPIGKLVMDARPSFRWSAVDLAKTYRVRVYDAGGNMVAEQTSADTHLTLAQPLERGKAYHWRVGARFGETDQWMQSALSGFGVLSSEDYEAIQHLRSRLPGSHLAMGVAYESAGLYDEAQREYRALRQANPNSKLAQRTLHSEAH